MHDSHMPCRAARRGEAHLVAWDRRQPPTIDAARTTALTSTHARLRKLRPQLGAALAAGGADQNPGSMSDSLMSSGQRSALISTEWLHRCSRQ
jgi:hypothetical protein